MNIDVECGTEPLNDSDRPGRPVPFFGTLLGWLGVTLTGTDAGSNALFGNLQKVTAMQLGLSPILMGAANSAGGVMGKVMDAQSIVAAGAGSGVVLDRQLARAHAYGAALWRYMSGVLPRQYVPGLTCLSTTGSAA